MLSGRAKRSVKRLIRRAVPVRVPQPDWKRLLGADFPRWRRLVEEAGSDNTRPRILLAPSNNHPAVTTLDSLLAVALTLRGARVGILSCDRFLPACQNSRLDSFPMEWVSNEFLRHGPKRDMCPSCYAPGAAMFHDLGVSTYRYSDWIRQGDLEEAWETARSVPVEAIGRHVSQNIPVGEHAVAGAIRFFGGAWERQADGQAVLRRYFAASLLTMRLVRRLIDENRPDCISLHHGIYVPQGILAAVARDTGVRVAAWCQAYRKDSFIFSHGDTYHHALMDEPCAFWEDLPLSDVMETELMDYLRSRSSGSRDWISFLHARPEHDLGAIGAELGVDFSRPCIGLLTNVLWDAQLHYPQNAFPGMLEWVRVTVEAFRRRPDLQLIIRVHPAEVTGQIRSCQPMVEELRRLFPVLPPNVFLIPPENPMSTYTVMSQCDTVLIYGTKTGVELTALGIPVIVAGEAWIRNKGLTQDVASVQDYLEALQKLPAGRRLDDETVRRARKYAYHFFFRRMIPLSSVATQKKERAWCPYRINIRGLDELMPGRDRGLDVICDGLISGRPFVYPAESMAPQVLEKVEA